MNESFTAILITLIICFTIVFIVVVIKNLFLKLQKIRFEFAEKKAQLEFEQKQKLEECYRVVAENREKTLADREKENREVNKQVVYELISKSTLGVDLDIIKAIAEKIKSISI